MLGPSSYEPLQALSFKIFKYLYFLLDFIPLILARSLFQPDRDHRQPAVSHGESAEAGGGAAGLAVGALHEGTRRNAQKPGGSELLLPLRPAPGYVSLSPRAFRLAKPQDASPPGSPLSSSDPVLLRFL